MRDRPPHGQCVPDICEVRGTLLPSDGGDTWREVGLCEGVQAEAPRCPYSAPGGYEPPRGGTAAAPALGQASPLGSPGEDSCSGGSVSPHQAAEPAVLPRPRGRPAPPRPQPPLPPGRGTQLRPLSCSREKGPQALRSHGHKEQLGAGGQVPSRHKRQSP